MIKVIFKESTNDGFNPGDSAMLELPEAELVVQSGVAYYDTPPPAPRKSPKGKTKRKAK